MLNPKDTADAETGRLTALKLAKTKATLQPYYVYCISWKADSEPYDKDNLGGEDIFRKQEAENTAMIKAHPDSLQYWYYRALNRQQLRNYQGALMDLNRVLKPADNYKNLENAYYTSLEKVYQIDLENAYYMRGAVKYRLNPKNTSAAEADRLIAIKLHRRNAILIPYKSYCSDWK
ncbi:MAG: hypothetical protein ACXVJD_08765 [Mucilaginibacter sp.]